MAVGHPVFSWRRSIKLLGEFELDADAIDVPQHVIDDREHYRNQFYKWLRDPGVKHKYWRSWKNSDGTTCVGLCYRSDAFAQTFGSAFFLLFYKGIIAYLFAMCYSILDMICPEAFMTQMTVLQQKVARFAPVCQIKYNEPMADHTSFRIGGNAEVFAMPKTREELAGILRISTELNVKPRILGAGTNVLAPDAGIDGIVICLKDCLDGMQQVDENRICVMAGVTMTRAAIFAAKLGLSGMEFAHGIPGTIGGGVYMNAGAYGGEMKDIVESVEVMDICGNIRTHTNEEMCFSYRHSRLEDSGEIVIGAILCLTSAETDAIKARMKELQSRRSASQPLDMPSAGSAFKRPAQGYAAALIDQAGLKGYRVGGAAISAKHAGFAVNLGGATAADVQELLRKVSDVVFEKTGIRLEPEVRIW